MTDLLKVNDITYKKNHHVILENTNLTLGSGHLVGLVGINGSGKTTLMRIITQLNKNYRGDITVAGETAVDKIKSKVSFSDDLASFSNSTKVDNIRKFYCKVYPDFSMSKFLELINFLDISLNSKLGSLSKGMREKLVIALCLSRETSLYLLDEPFSGVDSMARKQIIKSLLSWIDENSSLIISSHHISEISEILDEIVVIKDNTIIKHEATEDIRSQNLSLEEYFENLYQKEIK
ncbi:ABC transporter ATP-binding protein [Lactobacillus sp. YT155]|uniref:ATP-binding cassette domain-containing protein n=1 Tax=Lactobacillus sp. YT155 TaxID=3060955 RepID=UPI00265F872C|nr:ABC transporter ATP-binding protein [Lactobacillus sp. YT155]MDO1605343.1 ABC transporter ATP-binding protein [Lactobacillus sp. YT155]